MKIHSVFSALLLILVASCASRKEILYMQDAKDVGNAEINYQTPTIQPNDILKINVETLIPEAAVPYNKGTLQGMQPQNLQVLQLDGYLVSLENTIKFPVLGEISTKDLTTMQLEEDLKQRLVDGGHLLNPKVNVRLINAKVTILGEVNQPGTYTFTEQNITVLQALGYAGDLTINGRRNDVLMTREADGIRKVTHLDLTSAEFMNSDYYFIRPNDVIVVNQNNPRVKNAGFIGDIGTVLTIASLALSVTILLTR
ncbi:polysaccharide biosynthesis/export family protein [Winogradskyella aquimaris]|uniref:Polysaccharide biosynthesis/export family protein n=1 Tax=Winogradskyella aquimaris TaxID=864074 RepID=A0ABU5EMU0_9FLAO|nr:polysaccharide biosynthesis/export family protein [Winogradskyella aquimaris]MDY2587070.1 polysaccharide biosynthesis/export family protein [Winogradskyella aquimaris]